VSGFNDSIVGGIGTLIRQYIQSSNYVPGVSGWTINKDGSAEFNSATFRGVIIITNTGQLFIYAAAPAAGNLLVALSGSAGVDPYGNIYQAGLSLTPVTALNFINTALTGLGAYLLDNTDGVSEWLEINAPSGSGTRAQLKLGYDTGFAPAHQFLVLDTLAGGSIDLVKLLANVFQFGVGTPGGVASSSATFSQTLASGGFQQVTNRTVVHEDTSYAGAWTGATFTAPVDSFYDAHLYELCPVAAPNNRSQIRINGVAATLGVDSAAGSGASSTDLLCQWLSAGDTLTFFVQQQSGANQAMTGRINVGRRLA